MPVEPNRLVPVAPAVPNPVLVPDVAVPNAGAPEPNVAPKPVGFAPNVVPAIRDEGIKYNVFLEIHEYYILYTVNALLGAPWCL